MPTAQTMRIAKAVYGMVDDDEEEEPVLGRATLKRRSQELLDANSGASLPSQAPTTTSQQRHSVPHYPHSYAVKLSSTEQESPQRHRRSQTDMPDRSKWHLTPEMMKQPWGKLLHTRPELICFAMLAPDGHHISDIRETYEIERGQCLTCMQLVMVTQPCCWCGAGAVLRNMKSEIR